MTHTKLNEMRRPEPCSELCECCEDAIDDSGNNVDADE